MNIFCPDCGTKSKLEPKTWHCDCGGAWEPESSTKFDPAMIDESNTSIWRYKRFFDLDFDKPQVLMGAGWTPLLPLNFHEQKILVKPEYFSPTSSFKDRGTEMMINILKDQGVTHIAEDSSGNAGASIAAYAARAGMRAEIFVPAHTSAAKQNQIAIYGARVNPIPGPRVNSKLAAIEAVNNGIIFASHAYHPGFLLGLESEAFEVWEQMGRKAPDWYVLPVGQGVHLLGVWLGFSRLHSAGLIDRIPRMVGVQAALLAPVSLAYEAGLNDVPAVEPIGTSVAEGLAIAQPVRGRRLMQCFHETKGFCARVSEDEILSARHDMAANGYYIEPTSATAVAAMEQVLKLAETKETIVIALTGSGLKGSPQLG